MKLKHIHGSTVVNATPAKAKRMIATGSWVLVNKGDKLPEDEAPQNAAETVNEQSEGEYTRDSDSESQVPSQPQEEASPAPSIPEMRKWALENNIDGVKEKGKLPRSVIDAYRDAHQQ